MINKKTKLMTLLEHRKFDGKPLTTLLYKGKPCWIAREVGEAIGYEDGGWRFVRNITNEWTDEFIDGHDCTFLVGKELSDFKELIQLPADSAGSYIRHLLLLFESGMHLALIKTNKPAGKALRRFLVDKVLPQITRGGSYSSGSADDGSSLLRVYKERVELNDVPVGYFSVFGEGWTLLVQAIGAGLEVGPETIPDISIGLKWGERWRKRRLAEQYGNRIKHPHRYPGDYPQAKAGTILAWMYPLGAMGEFRSWLQAEYMPKWFPRYIREKVMQRAIGADQAKQLVEAFTLPELKRMSR